MTKIQAAVLWAKWNQQSQPPRCEGPNIEMEYSGTDYMSSTYHCLASGESVAHTHLAA